MGSQMFQSQLNINNSNWDQSLSLSVSHFICLTLLSASPFMSVSLSVFLFVYKSNSVPPALSPSLQPEMDFTVCLKLLFSSVDGWVQCISVCRCWSRHFSLSSSGAGGLSHMSDALCSLSLTLWSQRFEPTLLIMCVRVLWHIGRVPPKHCSHDIL